MAKTLANYDPLVQIPSGMTPAGADFPIVESHDILVGENDKRLDAKLDDIDSAIGNVGQTPIATQLSSKVNTGDIVTSVAATGSTSNNKIPSETAVRAAIEAKTINVDSTVTQGSTNAVSGGAVHTQLATKQDTLTFDTTPTASSSNPVTSGGVKSALDTKQDALTFDTTPTASSSNPVTSGGVKAALDNKQNTLTYETTPIVGSVNPVTSTGIRNAIDTAAAQNLGAMQAQYAEFVADADAVLDRASSLSNGMVACSNISAETTVGDTRILLYTGTTNANYTNGHWYYNSAPSNAAPSWTDGGAVGSAPTIDNTLAIDGAAANSKAVGDAIENIVTISNTQPGSNSGNKVWIKETTDEEVQIPTYAEHIAKANKADIATNNESDNGSGTISASKAYAIGDHFYINNTNTSSENYGVSTLYKATAAIASGDAIVVGTNCEASKVADEITSLSNDIDTVKADLGAANDEINALQVDELGTTVITASDFTEKTGGITYSYDSTEQSVTLTKTTTNKQDWQSLSTPVDFLVGKITEGKTYRMHYRADILSGTPVIRMDIRKSNNSTIERLLLEDGTDGYLDFVATSDMSLVSVFITASTATGACEVKYSDIYLCEVKGKTVIDRAARTEIADIRSHLSDANIYKTIILRMLSSMSYNASGASSKMYKELFSMFFKLKESVSITALPTDSINGGKEGACTDGKYIYQCCSFDNPGRMNLVKCEIATGEIVSTVEFTNSNLPFGHANDMTYDPVTGYLYVATMLSDGSVIRFDSEDLSYVDTIYLLKGTGEPGKVWQIAFNRVTRQLIVTAVDEYRLYDPDGQYISTHQLATKINATEQGMETDGVYLYRITYAPSCIDVCDMDGTRIKTYDFTVPGEPETMMYDWAGTYYLTTTNTSNGLFHIADFMESK